jgi:fatty-acyl-CoA synthase
VTVNVPSAGRGAAAIGVDDDDYGKRLRAFVVVSHEGDQPAPGEDELRDWVRKNLARFKVPREFVFIDELPRNATGKVLKHVLASDAENPFVEE